MAQCANSASSASHARVASDDPYDAYLPAACRVCALAEGREAAGEQPCAELMRAMQHYVDNFGLVCLPSKARRLNPPSALDRLSDDLALQLFSAPILRAFGVPAPLAAAVGTYTRLMIGTAVLDLLECQLETLFISLQFVKCDMAIGLVTGLGVNVGSFYYLVAVRQLGMRVLSSTNEGVHVVRRLFAASSPLS